MSSSSISLGRAGLDGLDDYLDNLQDLFEQLQLCSVDAANFEDVLTFAGSAVYFAVINKTTTTIIKPKEDTQAASEPPPPLTHTKPSKKHRKRNKRNTGQNWQHTNQNPSVKENMRTSSESESSTIASTPGTSYGGQPQKKPRPASDIILHETTKIGFVYLMQAPTIQQMNVGVIIKPEERGWGFARDALSALLSIAFEQLHCHRVQAQVMDGPWKLDTLKAFTKLSFTHEGTRRQSIYSPFWCGWKDVTTLAMLDTDWIMRENMSMVAARRAELTLWDDMFERHEKERQDLLKGRWVA